MKTLATVRKSNILFLTGIGLFLACQRGPSPPLSPAEAINSFVLADENLEIQLVASEPLVQDPVAISFDEGGRLWVVEMLGFMADIEGIGAEDRVGRISVLFDDDGDGRMDRGQIFLDSLVLPRALAVIQGGTLIAENIPLWHVEDTDGDFKADRKTLIDSTYGGSGMPEHSANGLLRGMDNWYYNAKSKFRYRQINGDWITDETEFRGQWGIAHDDAGRLFYNYNWSQLHADLVPPNALGQNKNHSATSGIDHGLTLEREVFPIRSNTAVNRGYVPGTLDEEGRLLEFASACGPMVYRGDAMPENYLGDAFVCEPTANLIKRNKVNEEGFMLSAKGAYTDREFLASTDERFRPISLASGPDGNLYVVDMYKGVIQDAPYMTPYLKEVTLARKLDKPVHMGRIWRIKSKNAASTKPIDLASAHPKTLVEQLGSTNGWTRDMAQRLLVEKGDLSILPELKNQLAKGNALGQLHALWTLEGLGYDQPDLYLEALNATDSKVVQAAMRLCLASAEQHPGVVEALESFIKSNYDGAASLVKMQMVLASHKIDAHLAFEIAIKFLDAYGQLPVARDVVMSSLENRESSFLALLLSRTAWKTYDQSHEIFTEMLATAIANKGEHQEIEQLFRIAGSSPGPDQIWIKEALFNGIINSRGSNDSGELVLDKMPDLLSRSEVPDALTRKLNWPGKPVKEKMASDTTFEIDSKVYAMGRQKFLNLCANCHGTQGEGMARFAPPLKHSEWVNGPEHKLAMILLHGMEGPITVNGKKYDNPDILPIMPSFSTLQNEDIAAIATYIRNSWGNVQPPISSRTVGHIRFRTQGQIMPWKASELDTLNFNMDL